MPFGLQCFPAVSFPRFPPIISDPEPMVPCKRCLVFPVPDAFPGFCIEVLCQLCPLSGFGDCGNKNVIFRLMTPDEQIIPGFDRFPGLASVAIDLYMPSADRLGGKPACSEEPACPQPLVQPLCSQWTGFRRGWFRVHGLQRVLHRGLQGKLPRNQPLLNGSFRFAAWMLTIWDGSGSEWGVPPIGGINGRVPEGVPLHFPGFWTLSGFRKPHRHPVGRGQWTMRVFVPGWFDWPGTISPGNPRGCPMASARHLPAVVWWMADRKMK